METKVTENSDRPKFERLFALLDEVGPIPDEDWGFEEFDSEWPERFLFETLDEEQK